MASKRGNTNMVKLLLDRGGQIDAKTRVSVSFPWMYVIMYPLLFSFVSVGPRHSVIKIQESYLQWGLFRKLHTNWCFLHNFIAFLINVTLISKTSQTFVQHHDRPNIRSDLPIKKLLCGFFECCTAKAQLLYGPVQAYGVSLCPGTCRSPSCGDGFHTYWM